MFELSNGFLYTSTGGSFSSSDDDEDDELGSGIGSLGKLSVINYLIIMICYLYGCLSNGTGFRTLIASYTNLYAVNF